MATWTRSPTPRARRWCPIPTTTGGSLTASTGTFANGWVNSYRYDGRDGVRYDAETSLYWMSVRAYDPTLGRFLSHDPLGRLVGFGLDTTPYVYAGNDLVGHTDPSGMVCMDSDGDYRTAKRTGPPVQRVQTQRVHTVPPGLRTCSKPGAKPTCEQIDHARNDALSASHDFASFDGMSWTARSALSALGAAIVRLTLPMPDWMAKWVPGAAAMWEVVGKLAVVILTAAILLSTEVAVAGSVFRWEASQPDSFWESSSALEGLRSGVNTVGISLNVAIAVFGAMAAIFLTNPLSAIGGVLLGIAAGAFVGLFVLLPMVLDRIDNQRRTLGYLS